MVTLQNITLSFKDGKSVKTVLNDLSLSLPEGKTIVVMGPSGCGKTTLLRVIAGLELPDTGNVTRETDSISYLFQDTALLPWLTAAENVNLVLADKKETLSEAVEWLARVDLSGEANTYPAALSGGMRQRVALAERCPPMPSFFCSTNPSAAWMKNFTSKCASLSAVAAKEKRPFLSRMTQLMPKWQIAALHLMRIEILR